MLKKEVQQWLTSLFRDPISQQLMKTSHLTKTQAETFLIDVLAEKITDHNIIYAQKAKLRLLRSGVSRGSFNRTLAQARKNVVKSIYTVILLGYLGIFDTPRLDPYIEIGNKIQTYAEAFRDAWTSKNTSGEHMNIINMLQNDIEKSLQTLAKPKSIGKKL